MRRQPLLETLESRVLLSGVTLITHGLGGDPSQWLPSMVSAIAARADLSANNFTAYTMTVTDPGHDGGPLSVSISKKSGTVPLNSTKSPEILIILDWSDVAGSLSLFGGYSRPSSDVGAAVATALADAAFLPDLGGVSLADLPIHLIGHSRGGSIVGQIAQSLGRRNIWVDQLTTFDPVPDPASSFLYDDPAVRAYSNVVFFDNYYQTQDSFATGFAVSGAHNVGPLSLPGGYVSFIPGGYHNNVHLYYQGTINTASNASDTFFSVNNAWYSSATRTTTGFAWTALEGSIRPTDGIGSAWGGSAARTAVTVNLPAWADIGFVSITSGATYAAGQSLSATFKYQDKDSASTVTWLLDPDQNPLNGNEITLTTQDLAIATNVTSATLSANLPYITGSYYLLGRIADSAGTRQAYASTPVNITRLATVIGTTGSNGDSGNTRDLAFDGNLNTFFDGPAADGNWVGLDLGVTKRITRVRYAPRADIVSGPDRMIGGVFQASNDPTFTSGVVDLYTIPSGPDGGVLTEALVSDPNSYRYVRYLAPAGSYGDVAEIQFGTQAGTNPSNHAPTLSTVSTLSTAVELKPFTITYDTLAAAANDADIDADEISFRIQSVTSGTLLVNGDAVIPGTTLVSIGDSLTWTPNASANGVIPAFTIKAFDGVLASSTAIAVKINTVLQPVVSVTATKPGASETSPASTGKGTYTFTRVNGPFTDPLTIHYSFTGAATPGDDFVALPGTVTIPAGAASVTLNLIPIDDALIEGAETAILSIDSSSDYLINSAKTSATVTIADNEPKVAITATKPAASETNPASTGRGVFTLTRTGGSNANPLDVHYSIGGSAISSDDFVPLTGTVTFAAGSATATITLTPVDDALVESAETVTLTIVPDVIPAFTVDPLKSSATVTIADNEPTIKITATKMLASETNPASTGRGIFTLTRTGGTLAGPLDVSYSIAGTATPGDDFTSLTGVATFAAGAATTTITLTPVDDAIVESPESVTLTLSAATAYRLGGAPISASVLIADNEPSISITTTRNASEVSPASSGKGVFTFTRTGVTTNPLTISYSVSGSATPDDDYPAIANTATFLAGQSSITLNIVPVDDGLAEGAETLTLALSSSAAYSINPLKPAATMTITDSSPVVSVVKTRDASEIFPSTTGKGSFTFTRTGLLTAPLTVHYSLAGTSTPDDYAPLTGTVTFAAGSATTTLSLVPVDDGIVEGNETVILTIDTDPDYSINPLKPAATLTLTDRNLAPTFTTLNVLPAAGINTPTSFDYDAVLNSSNAFDPESAPISFKVTAILSGSLRINGNAASTGDTFSAGDTLVWRPAENTFGTLTAFSIVASDGHKTSLLPVLVKFLVI